MKARKKANHQNPTKEESKKSERVRTEGKPLNPADVPAWVEDGDTRYKVTIEGIKQGAIVWADSRADAREKFIQLSGITSCERKIVVEEVDEDHGYTVDAHGVIDPSEL